MERTVTATTDSEPRSPLRGGFAGPHARANVVDQKGDLVPRRVDQTRRVDRRSHRGEGHRARVDPALGRGPAQWWSSTDSAREGLVGASGEGVERREQHVEGVVGRDAGRPHPVEIEPRAAIVDDAGEDRLPDTARLGRLPLASTRSGRCHARRAAAGYTSTRRPLPSRGAAPPHRSAQSRCNSAQRMATCPRRSADADIGCPRPWSRTTLSVWRWVSERRSFVPGQGSRSSWARTACTNAMGHPSGARPPR